MQKITKQRQFETSTSKLTVVKIYLYLKAWKYIPTRPKYIDVNLLITYWVNVAYSPGKAMMKL